MDNGPSINHYSTPSVELSYEKKSNKSQEQLRVDTAAIDIILGNSADVVKGSFERERQKVVIPRHNKLKQICLRIKIIMNKNYDH